MVVLVFILVLALVVLVHEGGHFFAAKRFGIRVDEFGFGFPPRVFSKKVGETLYSINLFPLGGFVKIFGESGEGAERSDSFISRPLWQRSTVIAAGVVMNLVLAWVLFSFGSVVGIPAVAAEGEKVEESQVTITRVIPGSPAALAKLTFGNVIVEVRSNEQTVRPKTAAELVEFTKKYRGETLTLLVLPAAHASGDALETISIVSRANPPPGEGPLGIGVADIGIYRVPWYEAPWQGAKSIWVSVYSTAEALSNLAVSAFSHHIIPEGVSGPVGLFALVGQTQRLGLLYFIQFIALLSVNLAVLNIIPFPALDGGRLLFLAIEKVRGRAVHFTYERAAHTIGFILLILLVLAVSYRDIHRFFP